MKVNKRKLIIWSVCTGVVIIVAFSIMSLVMVLSPLSYGEELMPSLDNVDLINYVNPKYSNSRQLRYNTPEQIATHTTAVETIINDLADQGKTNRFLHFFAGQGGEKLPPSRSIVTTSQLKSLSGGTYIHIVLHDSPYAIVSSTNDSGEEVFSIESSADAEAKDRLTAVYIMLGDVLNGFQEHTWLLCLAGTSPLQNKTTVSHKFITYGNYYSLAEYVNGLTI